MKKIRLDLTNIAGREAFQIYLRHEMGFPDWYGCNLDALFDMLTEIGTQTHVSIAPPRAGTDLAQYMEKVQRVLRDAAEENPNFTWEME